MEDYSDAFESFRLDGSIPTVDSDVELTGEEQYLQCFSDKKQWDNYANTFVYECDKFLRSYIGRHSEEWSRPGNKMKQRYTFAMAFKIMFGREYDMKKDAWCYNQLDRVLRYYSVTVAKGSTVWDGEHQCKKSMKKATVYTLSPGRLKKQPYSLRLRIEEMVTNGEMPNYRKLRVPKDNLPTGHSRNPKTEEVKNSRRKARAQWWDDKTEEEKEEWRERGRYYGQKANQGPR